jgi:hypothetical protein
MTNAKIQMKKTFLLLLITCQLFFTPYLLHASCNQSDNPNVFKVHGTSEDEKVSIEGACLDEMLTAMGEGKDIDIKYAEIKGGIDFTNPKFFNARSFDEIKKDLKPGETDHIKKMFPQPKKIVLVKGKIKIQNSVINGTVLTRKDTFKDNIFDIMYGFSAIFRKKVIFQKVDFKRKVIFDNSYFNDKVSFGSGTHFYKDVYFRNAYFSNIAFFPNAYFHGNTVFQNVDFVGIAWFPSVTFLYPVGFGHVHFAEKAYFHNNHFANSSNFGSSKFDGEAYFEDVKFGGDTVFYNVQFGKKVTFRNTSFAGYTDFRKTQFDNCSFNSAKFGIRSTYAEKHLNRKNIIKIIAKDLNEEFKDAKSLKSPKALLKKLPTFKANLVHAYRAAINEDSQINSQLNEYLLPLQEKEIKTIPEYMEIPIKVNFNNATFTDSVDFRNALFLNDTSFKETNFKELGLFDSSFFFNAKELGLVEKNDKDSLVGLNIDKSYFNLWKGLTFDQVFPHLHKRLDYSAEEQKKEFRDQTIENYIYLQENFRKIGRFEDADDIYYQRKLLEAENEKDGWKRKWNWILDKTCKYGTDFKQVVYVSLILIGVFALLYLLPNIPFMQKYFGTITSKDKVQLIKKEKLSVVWKSRPTIIKKIFGTIWAAIKYIWYALYPFWRALYLSVNTFTTVGTGDIFATGLFRWFVLLEGALGWFMLGLFIVVFAAQYIR